MNSKLSNPVLAAIHQAISDNPSVEPEEILRQLTSAGDDPEAFHEAWVTAKIQFSDQEGGELTLDEMNAELRDIIGEERAAQAVVPK